MLRYRTELESLDFTQAIVLQPMDSRRLRYHQKTMIRLSQVASLGSSSAAIGPLPYHSSSKLLDSDCVDQYKPRLASYTA